MCVYMSVHAFKFTWKIYVQYILKYKALNIMNIRLIYLFISKYNCLYQNTAIYRNAYLIIKI